MKLLLGVGHPADVHFFKHFAAVMKMMGHEVSVVARDKEITCYLLEKYAIPYFLVARHQRTPLRKIIDFFARWIRTYRFCRRLRPDMALGVGDFYLAQIGLASGFPTIVMTDTEAARHDAFLTFPWAAHILTPSCFRRKVKRQTVYNSYKELAYLGGERFTPDPGVHDRLGIKKGRRYAILRFTGRTAVHDIGCGSIPLETKLRAVREFSNHAKVFISSEQELTGELKAYQIPCPPERMHDALYYADLLYGDSATMASEAACLGTPAIYVDDKGRGYTDEQERRYGLVFNYRTHEEDRNKSVRKGVDILANAEGRADWRVKSERMRAEKADMTDFLVRFVLDVSRKAVSSRG